MATSCRIRRGLLLELTQLVAHHGEGEPRGVALAGQHPGEAPGGRGAVDAAQRAQLLADQGPRRLLLLRRVELVERRAGGLVVDALAPQLRSERPTRET